MATQPTLSGPPMPRPPREVDWARVAEIAFLLLLFALGFLVRLWPVWKMHWWDETVYLQDAEYLCCGKHNYSEFSSRPPFLSILFAGVFLLWNTSYAASMLTAALNALGSVFLYGAGKVLHGRPAAVIGALLLAFSPFFVHWGNTLLTDCPALTLTLLAFWFLQKAVAADSMVWFGLAGFVTGLSGLTRFTALITLFVYPFYLLRKGRLLQRAAWFGLGVGLSLGPYFLWSRLAYGSFAATLRLASANARGPVETNLFYLQNFGKVFPWVTVAGLALWLVDWLWGSLASPAPEHKEINRRTARQGVAPRRGSDAILWGWALLVLLYFSHLAWDKQLRFIIPMAAPLFLLAGRGLAVLTYGRSQWARTIGTAILVLALGYSFAPLRERFRGPFILPYSTEAMEVADYLNREVGRRGSLYCNFNWPVFGYYTWLKVDVLWPADMSFYKAFPDNMPEDGYVIIYKQVPAELNPGEIPYALARQPTEAWVDNDPHFRRMREFPSLVVYEYRRAGFH